MSRLSDWKMVISGFCRSFGRERGQEMPIDFVVTWVDGSDPAWQRQRMAYTGGENLAANGNGVCRYRDWVSFRYWFRAVERYAPWVRCVHLVTWGHTPTWLNRECPRLRIVRHEDFMPPEYLPTFNCNSLELNLFRIPGLSEHFVYFNDDILLTKPVSPEDFFVGGLPRHIGVAYPSINRDNELPYHLFYNGVGLANRENDVAGCIRRHPEKFFSHVYRSLARYNLDACRFGALPGMYFTHMGVPLVRSSMAKTWEKYRRECETTSRSRFREIHQLTHQIFSIEDILAGNFVPARPDWGQVVAIEDIAAIRRVYEAGAVKMLCLTDRDNMSPEEVAEVNARLEQCFGALLPEPCRFEREEGTV